MAVIIIAQRDDLHAHAVAAQLKKQYEHEVFILDLSQLASDFNFCSEFEENFSSTIILEGRSIDLREISAVWCRRVYYPAPSPELIIEEDQIIAKRDSKDSLLGLLYNFSEAGLRCINDPRSEVSAKSKPLQLHVAGNVGLAIPKTIITNNPRSVNDFAMSLRELNKQIIYKGFGHLPNRMIATQFLDNTSLGRLSELKHSPVIFQEYIEGKDIRVNIVGHRIFAAEILNSDKRIARDWRLKPVQDLKSFAIPESVQKKLIAFMSRLNLDYAACDFKLTNDGQWVFLEANPGGQFLFAEISAKQDISGAMADLLVNKEKTIRPMQECIHTYGL